MSRWRSTAFWIPESSGLHSSEKFLSAAVADVAILFVGWTAARLGIRSEDVHAPVLEINAFVDISEDDLNTLVDIEAMAG